MLQASDVRILGKPSMMRHRLLVPAVLGFMSIGGGAHAVPFSITVEGNTGADGGVTFTLSANTKSSTGDFNYMESEQAPDFIHFLNTSFDDPNATFSISDVMRSSSSPLMATASADFNVSDPTYGFTVTDTDGTSQTIKGYSLKFSVMIEYNPQTDAIYNSSATADMLLIPPPSSIDSSTSMVLVTGGPFSTVPLPASAPMFGAAVAALGVVGYVLKRKDAAAA